MDSKMTARVDSHTVSKYLSRSLTNFEEKEVPLPKDDLAYFI
jgi:hypothetical protein